MNTTIWRTPTTRIVAPGTLRRVWAAVTHCPQASVRELSARLYLSVGHVDNALHVLCAAGYIDFPCRAARARRILVPFAFIPEEPPPSGEPGDESDVDGIPMGGKRQ